jgi:hypothetical protein
MVIHGTGARIQPGAVHNRPSITIILSSWPEANEESLLSSLDGSALDLLPRYSLAAPTACLLEVPTDRTPIPCES